METITLISRKELIQRAYNSQGYRGTDSIVVRDRYTALEKMSDEELMALIEKKIK